MSVCDRDCFNCPYPDCVLDDAPDVKERAELKRLEKEIIFPPSPREAQIAAYQKAYREANREEIAAYHKAYREANRERILAKKREKYRAQKEVSINERQGKRAG